MSQLQVMDYLPAKCTPGNMGIQSFHQAAIQGCPVQPVLMLIVHDYTSPKQLSHCRCTRVRLSRQGLGVYLSPRLKGQE